MVADADLAEAGALKRWIEEAGDEPFVLDTADNLLGLIAELRPDLMIMDIDFGGPLSGLVLGAAIKALYDLSIAYVLPRRRISREVMVRLTGFTILFRPVRRIPFRFAVAAAATRKTKS